MRSLSVSLSGLVVAGLCACSGSIADNSDPEPDEVDDVEDPGEDDNDNDDSGGGGLVPDEPAACKSQEVPIPQARIWRLSATQYTNTVKQVFNVNVDVASFPLDGVSNDAVTSFDTHADNNLVTDQLGDAYSAKGTDIAKAMVTRLGNEKSCLTAATADAACARNTLATWAERAYRRPLSDTEKTRLGEFYNQARADFGAANATRMAFQAILQSPHFLYRFELGSGSGSGARVKLSGHEIASQLSYFLADSPPDAALLEAAKSGALDTAEQRREHAERLLARPEARGKLRTFFSNHLGLKALVDGKAKDTKQFPMFTGELSKALIADAYSNIEKAVFDGPGTLEALLSAPLSLGSQLHNVYGTSMRPGIITHPAILASLSNEATTSPVHRGLFYWKTLLCQAVPIPPPNAANAVDRLTDPANPDGNERVQWAYFTKAAPECASCHRMFHPVGLGLENYDPIGRVRNDDLDLTVKIEDLATGVDGSHEDGVALAHAIAQSPLGRACFALQMTTFGFGRSVDTDEEGCRLQGIADRFTGKDLDVKSLLVALTEDDSFVYRRAQ